MDATLKRLIDERVYVVGEVTKATEESRREWLLARREWLVEKRIEIMAALVATMVPHSSNVATARAVADAIIEEAQRDV